MNDAIAISLISAVSGVIIAYIVNIAKTKVDAKKAEKQPKDRMEQMFDGYERLIKQKDTEDERKARLMAELEEELIITRRMVKKLEHSLNLSQHELDLSREENRELKTMLTKMRQEYKLAKGELLDSIEDSMYNESGDNNGK